MKSAYYNEKEEGTTKEYQSILPVRSKKSPSHSEIVEEKNLSFEDCLAVFREMETSRR